MEGHKVPEGARFLDLSDYGRPLAVAIARWAEPRGLSPHLFTLLQALAGFAAAVILPWATPWARVLVFLLLPLKSMLDAVDGTLARLRQRPTRTGRFLDSDLDFLVNLALFGALVPAAGVSPILALVAFGFMELQGSLYHHLYVRYRHAHGGDPSARSREDARAFPYENARLVALLYGVYRVFYGWQDALIRALLQRVCGPCVPDRATMTLVSALGLGFQLVAIGTLVLLGRAAWVPWLFLGPGNLVALGVLARLRRL